MKSLSGLYLSGYNSNKIFIHAKAREFYEKLRMKNRKTLTDDSLDDSLKTPDESLNISENNLKTTNSHPRENTCLLSKWKADTLNDSLKTALDDSLKTINDSSNTTEDTSKTVHIRRDIRTFFGTTVKTS